MAMLRDYTRQPTREENHREALLCLPTDLYSFPKRVIDRTMHDAKAFLSDPARPMTEYRVFRDRMREVALSYMTEAERDERTMTLLGQLYGSSVR